MKKLWRLGMCLMLVMSLFVIRDQGVHAEEGFNLENLDITFSDTDGILKAKLNTGENIDEQISYIIMHFVNKENPNLEESARFDTDIDPMNGRVSYKSSLDLNQMKKGTFQLKSVTLTDFDGNVIQMSRSCTLATSQTDGCKDYNTALDGKWENLTIEGRKEVVYPAINSIKGNGFGKNIDLDNHQFSIDATLNITRDENTIISLVYDCDKSSEPMSLDFIGESRTATYNDFLRYRGENFTLAYIEVSTWKENVYRSSIYSSLSRDELDKYVGIRNSSFELHKLTEIAQAGTFDFSIQNYMYDVTPPELISADWEVSEVSLPGVAKFNFEVRDTESGYLYLSILTSNGYGDLAMSGGSVLDGKGYYEYLFTRYRKLDPVKVRGFEISDNAGNRICYLTDMDAYNSETGEYYGVTISNSGKDMVREWKKPVKELTFKRTQDYTEILKNDKTSLETLNKAKDGSLFVINTYESPKIDKSVFEAVQGKDVDLIFEDVTSEDANATGVQWIINGKDIKNPKTIDTTLKTELINDKAIGTGYGFAGVNADATLAEKNAFVVEMLKQAPLAYYADYIKQFDAEKDDFMALFWEEYNKHERVNFLFAENGELPGKVTVRFKLEVALRHQMPTNNLYLYYDHNGNQELISDNVNCDEENYYEFDITHNSKYVLTPKKLVSDDTNQEENKKPIDKVENITDSKEEHGAVKKGIETGDHSSSQSINWIYAGLGSLIIIAGILIKRYKDKRTC